MRKLTIVLALLIFSSPAWGKDVTIKQILELYDKASPKGKHKYHERFMAWETGMSWSNAYQKHKGGKPLYCLPDNLVMSGEQAFQIFRAEVKRKGEKATLQISGASGMHLLEGLMRTFPCKWT